MQTHCLELFRQFWKRIFVAALGTGALACVISLILLEEMPLYRSSVTLNMQPSEEALRFNNAFLGVSQFNPATIITQAHIERLLSRPVAERALSILTGDNAEVLRPDEPNAVDRWKAALWRTWAELNYGYFEPMDPRDQMLDDLMQATDVQVVAGSYILKLEVTQSDPDLAARAANALAQAYVDVASAEFSQEAAAVDAALARLRSETEAELARHMERRRELERDLGFDDVEEGRAILLAARNAARQALAASERESAALRARLDQTSEVDGAALAPIRADLTEADTQVDLDRDALAEAEAGLQSLDLNEIRLAEVDQRIAEAQGDLTELQARRITTELAREARLNQVRIINEAAVPAYPAFPKVLLNTLVATVLGGLLIMAPIAVADVLDDRVRTVEDLRRAVGARALPTVSRRLSARARRFRRTGRRPGRRLENFARAMGRLFLADGVSGWRGRPIYVTAAGTQQDVARLHAVIEASARITAQRNKDASPPEVVALPEIWKLTDWTAYRDGTVVIGVRPGTAERGEVERWANTGSGAETPRFVTVIA